MEKFRHSLAINLVEHFQFAPRGKGVPMRHWDRFPPRLAQGAEKALGLLRRHDATATFFVDDWIAARHGPIVARIADEGHEIAARIGAPADLGRTVDAIEAATGHAVLGCGLDRGLDGGHWSRNDLAALSHAGLRYALGRVGPAGPAAVPPGLTVIPTGGPCSRGEHLRLLPEAFSTALCRTWMRARGPRVFTFDLWELDEDIPPLAVHGRLARLRAHRNLDRFEHRFDAMFDRVRLAALRENLGLAKPAPAEPPAAPATAPAPDRRDEAPPGEPVTIVVPCYNEESGLAYLANVLDGVEADLGRRHPLSVVLVDDGSRDGTWSEMQRLFAGKPHVRLIRHGANRGIGAAIATGIAAAPDDIVAVIDSDCSYDPARIEDMLRLLGPDVALVTASPYHRLGGVDGVPQWRLVLSKGASALYRLVLRNKLATYTSCFRVCRKEAVAGMALRHDGYIGVVEMLARLDMAGWEIREYPVVLEARLLGQSKIRIARVVAGHLGFLAEILRHRLARRRPFKFVDLIK